MPKPKYKTRGRVHLLSAARWLALVSFAACTLLQDSAIAKTKAPPAIPAATSIELKASLDDAVKAVEEVAADPILYGTYVYEHDKTLIGARQQEDSSAFGNDKPPGKLFYKVIDGVVSPRHFKDTEDSGTITVRYVVQELAAARVSLRIEAIFITHKIAHASLGAVEAAEFGQVQQHLDRIQARAREAKDERKEEAEAAARPPNSKPMTSAPAVVEYQAPEEPTAAIASAASANPPLLSSTATATSGTATPEPLAAAGSVGELEQRVARLRHQVEAVVKAQGAELRSAPFHTAKTIETIPAKSEVAIVILTTYWYGVQTTDGHTGWIQRSQLEPLP